MYDSENNQWSSIEKEIAQELFKRAYDREISALIQDVREKASAITELDDLWSLHDFLSARRHEIDGKYDYDYSSLLFIFAELVRDGWLRLDELENLNREKFAKVAALTKI
ncbi:MAG: hypothetical protein IGR76_13335 [Synechococcales cyanobacterium T60_A2020_003]|nr:hypothetical protein [Synechococcales cyanobacterium T60_A2020_003]